MVAASTLPAGCHPVAKHLASLDPRYSSVFLDNAWKDLFSGLEPPHSSKSLSLSLSVYNTCPTELVVFKHVPLGS